MGEYFYPRPPRGGRPGKRGRNQAVQNFYPRPPRGGRPTDRLKWDVLTQISIHALREEGDCLPCAGIPEKRNFYPRPPRGGRRGRLRADGQSSLFLSTPSARRATSTQTGETVFLYISIHALREEGDGPAFRCCPVHTDFYPRPPRGGRPSTTRTKGAGAIFLSTPSARRATKLAEELEPIDIISIHALREEGD